MIPDPGLPILMPMPTHNIHIAAANGQHTVVATSPIPKGALIVTIKGRETQTATRHTLQIGRGLHLEAATPEDPERTPAADQWRFLNHKCLPNAHFQGRSLFALCPIPEGAEITFNYNATEYQMEHPFTCWCDHPSCAEGRSISGFADLPMDEQQLLLPLCQEHIRTAHREQAT